MLLGFALAIALWVAAIACAAAPATGPTTRRLPVPDAPAQARAEHLMREAYPLQFAARGPAQRQELGRFLLQQAVRTADDPVGRYVLLRASSDIAASAADPATAYAAARQLADGYAVEAPALFVSAMAGSLRSASSPDGHADICRLSLRTIDLAITADDYAAAAKLCGIAETAGRKGAHLAGVTAAQDRAKDVAALLAQFQEYQVACKTLRDKPDDAAANLLAGRVLCFVRDDWPAGLPRLARGSDAAMKAAAEAELAGPDDPARCCELAGRWWDLGAAQDGLSRRRAQRHAALWYRKTLASLSGLSESLARERVKADDDAIVEELGLRPGLFAELYKGIDFQRKIKSRVDASIDFDWKNDAPDPALPKDGFSIRWSGLLRCSVPGQYEITAIANLGAKVWLDGGLLIDGPTLSRRRNGIKVTVQLSPGLHPLRIDYWDTTGAARVRLLWLPPAETKAQPVPASALFHDPAAPLP